MEQWKIDLFYLYDRINELNIYEFTDYKNENYCQTYVMDNVYVPFVKENFLNLLEDDLKNLSYNHRTYIEETYKDLLTKIRGCHGY